MRFRQYFAKGICVKIVLCPSIKEQKSLTIILKKLTLKTELIFFGLIATDGSISSDLKNEKRRKLSIKLKAEDVHI